MIEAHGLVKRYGSTVAALRVIPEYWANHAA
jgi:hypothetical protein